MLIWILLAIFIALFVTEFFFNKKDIFHPSTLFCMVYIFSITCAILNIDAWSVDIGLQTFLILLFGGIEFLVINTIITLFFRKKYSSQKSTSIHHWHVITIPTWRTICFIIIEILILCLLFYNVLQIATQAGANHSLSQILGAYRLHTSYTSNLSLPSYTQHLLKLVTVGAYIFLFIVINNLVFSTEKIYQKIKSNAISFIPILIFIIQCIATSDRGSILRFGTAGIIMSAILWYNKNNWKRTIPLKRIITLVVGTIIILISFYYSATIIGRDTASKNLTEYITMYAGGSIENFDLYLKDPNPPKSGIPGSETFSYLIEGLSKYGFIDTQISSTNHLEFRYVNGITTGNVYTAYRRWYNDFGYFGVTILQGIMSIFYGIFYNMLRYHRKTKHIMTYHLCIIFYSYMIYSLIMHSILSQFYNSIVAVGIILLAVIAIVEYYFLTYTKESNQQVIQTIKEVLPKKH